MGTIRLGELLRPAAAATGEVGPTTSLLVPHAPPSAAIARHRFADELRARGLPGLVVDDATLVLSELVGNAIRHGTPFDDGCIQVSWSVDEVTIHVEVSDGGRGPLRHEASRPVARGSSDAETGRGLAIVGLLTSSWGSAFDSAAAVVWADVPVRQSAEVEAAYDAEERQEA